jgi:NADH-quinone oxidoreductase subunit L
MLIGSLALCGIPPFAGFFSKDAIIEAVHLSTIPGHGYAYFCVVAGVFVTAFYSFRLVFMTFHGEPRYGAHGDHAHAAPSDHDHQDDHGRAGPPRESPWVVTLPLVALAVPSVVAGWVAIQPMLFGDFFGSAIFVLPQHDVLKELAEEWHGAGAFILHGLAGGPFWLATAGIAAAAYLYLVRTDLPAHVARALGPVYTLLENKYYFDRFNDWFFAGGARRLGTFLKNVGDASIIDGFFVNGTAKAIGWSSALLRHLQSGYVYHYAFTMIIGLFALLSWYVH